MGEKRTWEDNIKTNFKKMEWESEGKIRLVPDNNLWGALVNRVMNLQVP
jgi:hypothetical protein